MKRNKLHKWSAFVLMACFVYTGCSQKNFPSPAGINEEKYEGAASQPPQVILVADENAKSNKEGEVYFDDANGYRYWKYSDGKFYLDQKYDASIGLKKKVSSKKKTRKASKTGTSGQTISAG